jgi:hypothetical protein
LPPAEFVGKESTTLDAAVRGPVDDDVRARIEALKRRNPSGKQQKQRFEYDENEPLRLVPETKPGGIGERDRGEQKHH